MTSTAFNFQEPLVMRASVSELPQVAKTIFEFVNAGDWLFLDGDLGSGKTALSKEISILFGIQNSFTSPTFSILNSEKLPKSINEIQTLLHLDLYRLKSGQELCFIGLEQEFKLENTIAIFEWPHILDEDEWNSFFYITHCAKPKRILSIHIDGQGDYRNYEIQLTSSFCST